MLQWIYCGYPHFSYIQYPVLSIIERVYQRILTIESFFLNQVEMYLPGAHNFVLSPPPVWWSVHNLYCHPFLRMYSQNDILANSSTCCKLIEWIPCSECLCHHSIWPFRLHFVTWSERCSCYLLLKFSRHKEASTLQLCARVTRTYPLLAVKSQALCSIALSEIVAILAGATVSSISCCSYLINYILWDKHVNILIDQLNAVWSHALATGRSREMFC